MRFQAGNVHESASLFNLKEKKFDTEDGRIRTHDPDGAVYYANHQDLRICWKVVYLSTYGINPNPKTRT